MLRMAILAASAALLSGCIINLDGTTPGSGSGSGLGMGSGSGMGSDMGMSTPEVERLPPPVVVSVAPKIDLGTARECFQSSQTRLQARCRNARKLRASFS